MKTLTDTIKEEKDEKIRKAEEAKEMAKKAKDPIARYDVAGEFTKIENVDGLIKIRVCSNPKLWLADKGAFIGIGKGLGEAAKLGQTAAEGALEAVIGATGLGFLFFTAKTIIKLKLKDAYDESHPKHRIIYQHKADFSGRYVFKDCAGNIHTGEMIKGDDSGKICSKEIAFQSKNPNVCQIWVEKS